MRLVGPGHVSRQDGAGSHPSHAPRVAEVLAVAKVFALPAEEVVPRVPVEVPAEAANFIPEFRRHRQLEEADSVPEKSDA